MKLMLVPVVYDLKYIHIIDLIATLTCPHKGRLLLISEIFKADSCIFNQSRSLERR